MCKQRCLCHTDVYQSSLKLPLFRKRTFLDLGKKGWGGNRTSSGVSEPSPEDRTRATRTWVPRKLV
jgi:hypothetical protein